MAEIIPFKGIRYDTEKAGPFEKLVAPPYDVISPALQDDLYARSIHNVVRIDFTRGSATDSESDNRYTRAAAALNEWLASGALVRDPEPCIYYYRLDYDVPGAPDGMHKSLTAIICMLRLEEWEKGVVLPHEKTLKGPKVDRMESMKATGVSASQIFSLYSDPKKAITAAMEKAVDGKAPYMDIRDDDGARHRAWAVSDGHAVDAAVKSLAAQPVFIADGHHRYETALAYRDMLRENSGTYTGDEIFNFVPMALSNMDEDGLTVLPTHRLVDDVSNVGPQAILERASEFFEIEKYEFGEEDLDAVAKRFLEDIKRVDGGRKRFGFSFKGGSALYLLMLKDPEAVRDMMACPGSDTLCGLDVTILHTLIIERIMGIDTELIARTQPVKFEKEGLEAIRRVADGEFDCCFLINPTKVSEVRDISIAGEIMPQKSTYFYPKLLTGLVITPLHD